MAHDDMNGRGRRRSMSTDPDVTIDLLKDPRFCRSDDWFGDASFACKSYPYGNLTGRPTHCPDPKKVEAAVMESVREAEECQSSDEEDNGQPDVEAATGAKEMPIISMIRRLATKPSMVAIRFLGWSLSKLWRAAFTSVHLHNADVAVEAVKRSKARPGTALIILPTHRSHADYLLMSYIFFGLNLPVPLIAAGDNLNVPLLGGLLARAGAFFIRRSKSTPRYRLVLQAYLYELARSGVPVEFFIEGGRSRRGNVGKPKLGLLGMIIQMVRDGDLQDALLLPVSLDYDMVPEGNGFAQEVLGTGTKKPESLWGTIKAAFEWMIWGKRGGGVYVGFGDKILSVNELIARFSKRLNLTGSHSSFLSRTASPFDPTLVQAVRRNNRSLQKLQQQQQQQQQVKDEEESSKEEKRRLMGSGHQLHHHHAVPPPAAMFRGGSGTSLATSVLDDDGLAQDVGRVVVEAQRDASLITVGGIASSAMLMAAPDGERDTLEAIKKRAYMLVQILVELGHGHRIPDGTLNSVSLESDIERAVEVLGGPTIARSGGAKARVCLRYAAAPVIVRLLPVFVVCLKQKIEGDFHSWLAGMFDVEVIQDEEEEDEEDETDVGSSIEESFVESVFESDFVAPTFRRDLLELIAPAVMILSSALQIVSHWRLDAVVTEEDAVRQVREMLANSPFPELLAPLEINAAFRACVIQKVLKRIPVIPPTTTSNQQPSKSIVGSSAASGSGSKGKKSSAPKKVSGYELEPTYVAPLARGRSAVVDARKELERILKV